MIQKNELKEEVVKLHETLEEFEKELAKMESSKKYKSPRTSLDTETIQMFRNMVRSDLRLNPQRVAEEEPEEEVRPDLRFNSQRVAEEEPEEEEEVHSDLHLNPQHVEEEEPEEEGDFFDQNSVDAIQLNVADEISPLHKLTPSPIRATPPDARPKPLHNYTPRNEDHLFKVPQPPHHAAPKNIVQTTDEDDMNNSLGLNTSDPVMDSQSGGPDFFNLLGNSSDNTGISFLQEHTNNSDTGGANFFFGGSSPRGQKDESSHGFLF
uniref:Uncharacterized protein n=1 Tax=Panagrolaimus superbus TaxID=310955 RepID=A0A914YUN5_9BILA